MAFFKQVKRQPPKQVTVKASNVKVVNTPTVKVASDLPKPVPTLNLSSDDLAAIKDWKVGGKYKLELEVEQTSMRQGNDYYDSPGGSDSNGKKVNATFKVTSIKEA